MEHELRKGCDLGLGRAILTAAGLLLLASAAGAQGARPLTRCAPDAVVSGTVCIDRYEASVWRVEDPTGEGASLVKRILTSKISLDDLIEGAEQLGSGDDYGACGDPGEVCDDVFAVSIAGVPPSANATWFQAQQACRNSGKRLPTNAEWQAAVAGTPAIVDDGLERCNTAPPGLAEPAGSRSVCVSQDGAFDMIGNLAEWVADWVPLSTACGAWPGSIDPSDRQCLAGASTGAEDEPGALVRGGDFDDGTEAGRFAVDGRVEPSTASSGIGFRCVR